MKRNAEKENKQKGHAVKERKTLVEVLTEQNQQHEDKKGKPSKVARPITKVLRSLNADVSQDYRKLLYNFLPRDQRKKGAEMAAFCFFVQEQHQIFVRKSSNEKTMT